ncbi:hypothetical protein F4778DRAFT_573017 [Xylariomycetidae sp. FL2044]|nr:hypothetical protein F4778DRAFT_573017 [Xylariomycetidae sp. FL2044]
MVASNMESSPASPTEYPRTNKPPSPIKQAAIDALSKETRNTIIPVYVKVAGSNEVQREAAGDVIENQINEFLTNEIERRVASFNGDVSDPTEATNGFIYTLATDLVQGLIKTVPLHDTVDSKDVVGAIEPLLDKSARSFVWKSLEYKKIDRRKRDNQKIKINAPTLQQETEQVKKFKNWYETELGRITQDQEDLQTKFDEQKEYFEKKAKKELEHQIQKQHDYYNRRITKQEEELAEKDDEIAKLKDDIQNQKEVIDDCQKELEDEKRNRKDQEVRAITLEAEVNKKTEEFEKHKEECDKEKARLNEELVRLEHIKQLLTRERDLAIDTSQGLLKEQSELKARITTLETEKADLQEQNTKLEGVADRLKETEEKLKDLQDEHKDYVKKHQSVPPTPVATGGSLQDELGGDTLDDDGDDEDDEEGESTISQLRQELGEKRDECTRLQDEKKAMQEDLRRLKTLEDEKENSETKLRDAQNDAAKLADVEKQMKELQAALASAREDLDGARKALQAAQARIDDLEAQLQAARQEESEKHQSDDDNDDDDELREQLEEAKKEAKKWQDLYDEYRATQAQHASDLEQGLAAAQGEIADLSARLQTCEDERAARDAAADADDTTDSDGQSSSEDRLRALQDQVDALRGQVGALQRQLDEQTRELEALAEQLQANLPDLEEQLRQLRGDFDKRQNMIDRARRRSGNNNNNNNSDPSLLEAEEENARHRRTIDVLQRQVAVQQALIDSLRDRKDTEEGQEGGNGNENGTTKKLLTSPRPRRRRRKGTTDDAAGGGLVGWLGRVCPSSCCAGCCESLFGGLLPEGGTPAEWASCCGEACTSFAYVWGWVNALVFAGMLVVIVTEALQYGVWRGANHDPAGARAFYHAAEDRHLVSFAVPAFELFWHWVVRLFFGGGGSRG